MLVTLLSSFILLFPAPPYLGLGWVPVAMLVYAFLGALQLYVHDPALRRRGRLARTRHKVSKTCAPEYVPCARSNTRRVARTGDMRLHSWKLSEN